MRLWFIFLIISIKCSSVYASEGEASYLALLKDDDSTWCVYSDEVRFRSEAEVIMPTESARIIYSAGVLTELTYQVQPESGDWMVIDKYRPEHDRVILRRAIMFVQRQVQVIEETEIQNSRAGPFRLLSTTTFDGKATKADDLDYPEVPIKLNLNDFPFMSILSRMKHASIIPPRMCKKLN